MKTEHKLGTIWILGAGLALAASACRTQQPVGELRQGWDDRNRHSWYQATQGSRLMPQTWTRALERADSQELFFTDANLSRFRFLPWPESNTGLPIGFAVDRNDARQLSYTNLTWYRGQPANEPWIGLNCSACHTARLTHQGQETTVDGGPSLLDFQGFIEGVDAAMTATQSDPAKWERFAARVLAGRDNAANRDLLRQEFGRLLAFYQDNARLNASPMRYGYGRLDAVGHILNKVSQLAVYELPGVRATANAADAPVNYPFLWDIYRHDRLQWNGIVASRRISLRGRRHYIDVGAMGRNTGEVIGVFGDVLLRANSTPHGFRSSVRTRNLDLLETELRSLQAPRWPANFPPLNQARVGAGRALFERRCIDCHRPQAPGTSIYPVRMEAQTRTGTTPSRNNTDPWMACNAITYVSATGKLQGTRSGYLGGEPLPEEAPVATMLSASVIGTIVGHWEEVLASAVQIFFGIERLPEVEVGAEAPVGSEEERQGRLEICFRANDLARGPNDPPPFAYKARPLDGIWATAPYLHNGSVPTLYDLLLPAAQRPQSFNTGTREYDPVRGGYRTDAAAAGNAFRFVARGNGNSNEGHDYNVGQLTDEERWALVEYLKSL